MKTAIEKQQEAPSKREKFKALGKDFLANTSMHGLKYIGEENRHIFERVLWVFMFGIGVSFAGYFCYGMLNKFYSSPAVMSIESTDKKLATFPFASITVCNQNKLSKSRFNQIMSETKYAELVTKDQMKLAMLSLLKVDEALDRAQELLNVSKIFESKGISTMELINITMQAITPCDNLLLDCQWLNRPTPCNEIFELIPTDEGFCCGFNPIASGWKVGGAQPQFNVLKRVHLPGYRVGLTVAMDADVDDYFAATGSSNGFKVLLHHPPEYPEVGERGYLISPGYEIGSGLNPMSSYNTLDVDKLGLDQRRCYLDSENFLKFHANYSVSRCLKECLTNWMREKCNCHPFNYAGYSPNDRMCGLADYICLAQVQESFRNDTVNPEHCDDCYPKCHDVWYFNDLSMAPFPGELFLDSRTGDRIMAKKNNNMTKAQFKGYMARNVALLNVFYKEMTGYSYRNDVRYGIDDFISSIGGLLGLGFGFSVISAIEVIYFFGIRWIFNNWRGSQKKPTMTPGEKNDGALFMQRIHPANNNNKNSVTFIS